MGWRLILERGAWLAVLCALVSCGRGGNSSVDVSSATTGGGGSGDGGDGTAADVASGQGGTTTSTASTQSATTQPTAGSGGASTSTGGASSASAGGVSSGGAAGTGGDGLECGDARCTPGESCAVCRGPDSLLSICTVDSSVDPSGFAEATAECQTIPQVSDCDGQEDCRPDQYCVASGTARCNDEPPPGIRSCCFSCDAPPNCILCSDDADCPDNERCVEDFDVPGGFGCR